MLVLRVQSGFISPNSTARNSQPQLHKRALMAKPNYSFAKKQKEIAKKNKKKEKLLKKIDQNNNEADPEQAPADAPK